MAGQLAGPPNLPPFEPSVSILSSLSTTIQTSISQYEKAKNPAERASALKTIQSTSARLGQTTAPIQQQFMELNFSPYINTAVRLSVEMGLFLTLPKDGGASTVAEMTKKLEVEAEEEFVLRISRTLGAFNILEESTSELGLPAYSHTPFSRFLTHPLAEASSKHLYDMLQAQTTAGVSYYLKYGFKTPADSKNTPYAFAHGTSDESVFDILERISEKMVLFNDAMALNALNGLKELVAVYPFDKLESNSDGVVLVDVGSGKGHVINEIRKEYPEMKGKFVLEDMKVVLEGGTMIPENEVILQPFDFFKEIQPIKGSNYFLKSIFHDWPDTSCLQILKNLTPAIRGSPHSKLLVCELVLPDHNPGTNKVLRDMNMLTIAGKERSRGQWEKLLGEAGFKIKSIYGLGSPNSSIIECVLDE